MFAEWLKAAKDAKATLAVAQALYNTATAANDKHGETVAELAKAREGNFKYKEVNEFLKHKLEHSTDKLNKEIESNTNQERNRTSSCESLAFQADPQTKL